MLWKICYAVILFFSWVFGYWAGLTPKEEIKTCNALCDRCGKHLGGECFSNGTAFIEHLKVKINLNDLTFCQTCTNTLLGLESYKNESS
jgi:hypothetical protein